MPIGNNKKQVEIPNEGRCTKLNRNRMDINTRNVFVEGHTEWRKLCHKTIHPDVIASG
jgi:hypothetical protein